MLPLQDYKSTFPHELFPSLFETSQKSRARQIRNNEETFYSFIMANKDMVDRYQFKKMKNLSDGLEICLSANKGL